MLLILVTAGLRRRCRRPTIPSPPTPPTPWRRPARGTGSAPTISVATSTRASSTARASRSSSASPRPLLGSVLGGIIGLFSGVRRRQDRPHHPARPGHPPGPAPARPRPGDVGRARAVPPQRGHRHLDPHHAARGAGHPRERAVHPRDAVRRGGARARAPATCASPSATSCPTPWALHRPRPPRSSAAPSWSRPRCRSSGSACPSRIPRGAACSPCRPPSTRRRRRTSCSSPALAISLAVFGSNLLGDALRDTLDPRLRGA